MKKKTLKIALLLAFIGINVNAQDYIKIVSVNGKEKSELLSIVGKITFSNENMYLYSKDNQKLAESPLNEVKKIVFTGQPSDNKEVASNAILVYPNPSQDVIFIEGLNKTEIVRIFNLSGTVLKSEKASEKTQINVSDLEKGTYLLQIGTEVLKFIKE